MSAVRLKLLLVVVMSLAEPGGAAKLLAGDRAAGARAAEAKFLGAHLFAEGRGLHTGPGMREAFLAIESTSPTALQAATTQLGFVFDDGAPVGLNWVRCQQVEIGVAGCAACHVGRAAGQTIVGLGNKSIDLGQLGRELNFLSSAATDLLGRDLDAGEQALFDDAERLGDRLSDPRSTNQTRGLVATSLVLRWFYEQADAPLPANFPSGSVKVPHLWGYRQKREAGLFVDGFGDGRSPGWPATLELTAGQTPAAVQRYADRLVELKDMMGEFLPPAYLFEIDRALADQGQKVFADHCSTCHGRYQRDAEGWPISAAPQFIEYARVGTDSDRLQIRSPELERLIARNPLGDLIRHRERPLGYFAPRLEGVWSRFPYLHNGSVPTLEALLTPAATRPGYWSLDEAGERHRFDARRVGLTLPAAGSREAAELQRRGDAGDRSVYSVRRIGHSNRGHEFGVALAAPDKAALVEYLKTL